MSILTILFAGILATTIWYAISIANGRALDRPNFKYQLTYIKSLGLFTMISRILGQLVGLYAAFEAIERAHDISPAIIFGGLKVSMITTLTGILFYLVSIILWFVLNLWYDKKLALNEGG